MNDPNRVESLFFAALERPPADRAAYLDEACAGDADLRRRVERSWPPSPRSPASSNSLRQRSPRRWTPGRRPPAGTQPPTTRFGPSPATADHSTPHEAGTVIAGRYTLVEVIGEGGMGTRLPGRADRAGQAAAWRSS